MNVNSDTNTDSKFYPVLTMGEVHFQAIYMYLTYIGYYLSIYLSIALDKFCYCLQFIYKECKTQ